jgi:hypothetical protein
MMLSLLPFLVERRMRLTPGRCAGLLADGGCRSCAAASSGVGAPVPGLHGSVL